MRYIILIILAFFVCSAYSQQVVSKYIIDFEKEFHKEWIKENTALYDEYVKDSTNYFITFENGFNNDEIKIYANGKIIYEDIIGTDDVSGLAKTFKIQKAECSSLTITINNSKEISIPLIKQRFILINFDSGGIVNVSYSSIMPCYY